MSSESTEESDDIMCATYRALCRHGYADLTMQDIADEWNKSKAALHYHYDTKQGLLLSFLDYLFDQYRRRVADPSGDDARERLLSFLDASLAPSDRDASREFQTAALEIKAQAPYEGAFRDRLVELDEFVRRRVRELVAAGVEDGSIRGDVDPAAAATTVVTLLDGAHTRRVALGASVDEVRQPLYEYVENRLTDGRSE
ncbi:TetR/AcrR family transcriptional regulator [Salinirarus marinus]|uniref:TetR/AcrR family transcriptional regulator n=1 Tax=Salinirarus marinus TaxID=3068310 RepID=UPI003C6C3E27